MAKIRPVGVGGWVYTGIHLCLIALALALVGVTAYAISISRDPTYSILIVGVFISILTDMSSILLYNAKFDLFPVTIVGDFFAIGFYAFGTFFAALGEFNGGDDGPNDPHPEIVRNNPGATMAMELSLALVGLRTISFFATAIMGCVVIRRWKREREGEEIVMQ